MCISAPCPTEAEPLHKLAALTALPRAPRRLLGSLGESSKGSCGNPLTFQTLSYACLTPPRRLFVRKRAATATVVGRPGRPACLILSGFRGHAPAGTWGRLSVFWPGQWHPFVSPARREEGGAEHSMLIAPAGDWTQARIAEVQAANGTQRRFYVRLLRTPGKAIPSMMRALVAMDVGACAPACACAAPGLPQGCAASQRSHCLRPQATLSPPSPPLAERAGFMFTTCMWRSIVCVASGAGIAPVLPVMLQRAAPSIFVVWITSRCGMRRACM